MRAVSVPFKLLRPGPAKRRGGLRRLRVLAAACPGLGTRVITLCSGTRDPEDMWRGHSDNQGREAWRDLRACLAEALKIAEAAGVTLAVEPEVANVVDSAKKAA